jgi:hypothetical protein
MTCYNWEVATPFPTNQMHITMADACGRQADFHFTALRRIDLDFFHN